ncbi:RNA helicase [Bifidobacterium tissieri]|uniref:RNA helicase n=2 Tax=Bifidobacterium tissieri TaxID=1630162 RepID=A0A261FDS4_9BIFI|nr:RNA helicase [Bifidobacterium tissieri]
MRHVDDTRQDGETRSIIEDADSEFEKDAERRRTESVADAVLDSMVSSDVRFGLVHASDELPGPYAPKLVANRPGLTMENELKEELQSCTDFDMSVAFVSPAAVGRVQQSFYDWHDSHDDGSGRIITSTKNYFNKPETFEKLADIQDRTGIEIRVWSRAADDARGTVGNDENFHPKGYIFTHRTNSDDSYVDMYVGSSNLTDSALTDIQREWNLKVSSLPEGDLVRQVREELERQIGESEPLTREWIKRYEEDFRRYAPPRREIIKQLSSQDIQPNAMQREALENLRKLREHGERRAIVISATGTGKTFLAAFDVRQFKPKRMLYLAQQQQILVKSMESFQKVLGCPDDKLGLFSGTSKQQDRKYVFATVQTMRRADVLAQFKPDEFDYILVDEAHHSGAKSYRQIMDYFSGADFMLGMTATPERTDDINIFELFDHNVAYEIRLQRALEENMLCPFEYHGVTEYLGDDGVSIDVARDGKTADNAGQLSYEIKHLAFDDDQDDRQAEQDDQDDQDATRIQRLTSEDRVRYIIDKIQQYGQHQQITGLVFCSRNEEAERLSDMFNRQFNQQMERPYRTAAVTSSRYPNPEDREPLIRQLENGELDYLFTVDIFNEGVDIPALNQIIMLRNTESSIVFTQQLGRGLRKFPHKDRVVVIDFIGNYANNYLIPVALYGNTGDRDTARRNMQRTSIGLSSISFDRISRDRILRALDTANWTAARKMQEQYLQLRYEYGRIPMLMDLYEHDSSVPPVIALVGKDRNYLSFVCAQERKRHAMRKDSDRSDFYDQLDPVSDVENAILKMATAVLLPGVRPHELVILDALSRFTDEHIGHIGDDSNVSSWTPTEDMTRDDLEREIATRFPDAYMTAEQMDSALHVLDFTYFEASAKRFGDTPLIELGPDGRYRLSDDFARMLHDNRTFRIFFADTLRVGLRNCQDRYDRAREHGRRSDHGFLYEERYSLAEIMRMLGWQKERNGQMVGGYLLDKSTDTMPIFVKYASSQYEDQFLNPQEMSWYSKNDRSLKSPEFQWMAKGTGDDWDRTHFIPLFVMRKEEADDSRTKQFRKYYYVGHVAAVRNSRVVTKPDATGEQTTKVVLSALRLDRPLDPELYRHITGTYIG